MSASAPSVPNITAASGRIRPTGKMSLSSGLAANRLQPTFEQLRTHSDEHLHSNYGEAAWNDRHGRVVAETKTTVTSRHVRP
jgi:hypothetical protein